MWAGYEQAGITTTRDTSTNRIESVNRYMQRDNPSRTRLANVIGMLVEKWTGQAEEGR